MPTIACNECGAYVGQSHTADCPTRTAKPAARQPACGECGALAGALHAANCSARG